MASNRAIRFPTGWALLVPFLSWAFGGSAQAACDTSICTGGDPCTISGTHSIDDACILDFGTKTVTVLKGAKLDGGGGSYTILAGTLNVIGELESVGGDVTVDVVDDFTTQIVSNSAGRMDFREGGTIDVAAGGDCSIGGKSFDTSGTGGNDGGDIDIVCDGAITITKPINASGGGDFAFGGWITISGASVTATAEVRSVGTQEGDGGDVDISATGAIDLENIIVTGSGEDAWGGFVTVDGGSVTTGGRWNTNGGDFGSGGDITIVSGSTVTTTTAANFTCKASGGGDGCFVDISGVGDVTLAGDIDAGAIGEDAFAGFIGVVSNADIEIASTANLSSHTGSNGFVNGDIEIGPALNIDHAGVLNTRTGSDGGTNTIRYFSSFVCTGNMNASDPDGNQIECQCVDVDQNGCDEPLECVSDPDLTSCSDNPTAEVTPVCGGSWAVVLPAVVWGYRRRRARSRAEAGA